MRMGIEQINHRLRRLFASSTYIGDKSVEGIGTMHTFTYNYYYAIQYILPIIVVITFRMNSKYLHREHRISCCTRKTDGQVSIASEWD